jgi:hypothetical protein
MEERESICEIQCKKLTRALGAGWAFAQTQQFTTFFPQKVYLRKWRGENWQFMDICKFDGWLFWSKRELMMSRQKM